MFNNNFTPPAPENVQQLFDLISLLANPDETRERVAQFNAAAGELAAASAAAAQAQAELAVKQAEYEEGLQKATAEHEGALERAQTEFDARRLRQETALAAREARLAELEGKVTADAAANAVLRDELDKRLRLIKEAAA
jgi:hypothetical protein